VEKNAKLIRQTLALTCSLRVESLHTWLALTISLLQSQRIPVTTKFHPQKVEHAGAQT